MQRLSPSRHRLIRWTALCAAAAAVLAPPAALEPSARAHETDQFTIPPRRVFYDWGPALNRWTYGAIDRAVRKQNAKIRAAVAAGKSKEVVAELQSPEAITDAVNDEFPIAYNVINDLDKVVQKSKKLRQRNPGRVIGDRPIVRNVRQHFEIPFNPLRPWYGATIRVYDTHLGTDKVGHFTDMGMIYWRAYKKALAEGKSEEEATATAVRIGTHGAIMSERGILGYVTAGAYSNADLQANFMGFQFYRNLTEPIPLKGEVRPPLLVRDGDYWKPAPHVRRDSGFYGLFISDHMNEALNPSVYLAILRSPLRKAVRQRAPQLLARHADRHGNHRPGYWFDDRKKAFETYYGTDYGHEGTPDEHVSIGNSLFGTLTKDADVHKRDLLGLTPLHRAAWGGYADAVGEMIGRGADVRATVIPQANYGAEFGATPLHLAAAEGHVEAARVLLDHGADVNARDHRGVTPLHRAVDHPAMVEFLLSRGADARAVNGAGASVLHWASDAEGGDEAIEGATKSIALLIDAGADVHATDHDGRTPLHGAAQASNQAGVSALLARGADVHRADKLGATPLHLAAKRKALPFLDAHAVATVKALLGGGADVARKDDFGFTPLHDAARTGPESVVVALLESGARPDVADDYGSTPLHLACRAGRSSVAIPLVERGADVNVQNAAGSAPLHEAAAAGDQALVRLLLNHKAQPALRNHAKVTPAEIAGAKGYAVIEKLINRPQ